MSNVLQVLEESPALIASAAEAVRITRAALDLAKHNLGVSKAIATVKNQDAKNQTILAAMVTMDADVRSNEIAIIECEKNYELAKIQHDQVYNDFISARKICGMDRMELEAIRGTTIKHPNA